MVLLARLGRLGDAERVGTEYLKAAGEVPPILNALASQAMGRKDFATAGAYVKRSLAADPKAAATREAEALLFLAQRDQTGARLALNEALKHSPDRVSSLALLAELLAKQGKREEARGVYERILQLDRENVLAANNLAVIYLEDSAELTEALRLAELAVEKGRRGPRTLDTLGWVQVKMGTYETAAKTLEEARKGLLKDPEVAFHLGVAYQKLRKNDQARKLLKEALDAPQKGDWAIDAGQALQELDAAKL
jgi:Flp pilus assembly protein TadD